ncbi:MAG: penicillin-binding transpeptidase domain-containing protein, partial [Bacteroidales bacterium]
VKPRFVEEVLGQSGSVYTYPTEVLKSSVCSSSTLKQLRGMMKGVVEYGTAKSIRTDAYQFAGKTGTAQIAMNAGGYGVSKRHYASFVGFFPFEEPRYSCIVTVSAPTIGGTGGGVAAAPVFKSISDRILAMEESLFPRFSSRFPNQKVAEVPVSKSGSAKALKVALREMDVDFNDDEVDSDWVSTQSAEDEVILKDRKQINGLVPNVLDMGLKDALFLLESAGLRVSVKGKGRVVSQSQMPGSKLVAGSRIEITLR